MVTKLTDDNRENLFIVDNMVYERKRSKVEMLVKVYDHARDIHSYGFRHLTLGWSDGNTFLPVNGSLISSEKENYRICDEKEKINRCYCGFKARKLAQTRVPSVMLEMLDIAAKSGNSASCVLFDSWFCFHSMRLSLNEERT